MNPVLGRVLVEAAVGGDSAQLEVLAGWTEGQAGQAGSRQLLQVKLLQGVLAQLVSELTVPYKRWDIHDGEHFQSSFDCPAYTEPHWTSVSED